MIHECGIIVRDVQPNNIAMGLYSDANTVYLLDFGLARNFVDPDTGGHIPPIDSRSEHVGTRDFCSASMDAGNGQNFNWMIPVVAY